MTLSIEPLFDPRTSTLTFVVWDNASRDALVIDPVLDYDPAGSFTFTESVDKVSSVLREKELTLRLALDTHAHADHLSGSQLLKRRFGAGVVIGERIRDVQQTFQALFDLPALATDGNEFDRLVRDGETFSAGTIEVEVIATLGHTPACVTYRIGDAVFTGDALFTEDYARARPARRLYVSPCDTPARTFHR